MPDSTFPMTTVLVVDDSTEVLRAIERRLERDARVLTATGFDAAFAVLEAEHVDLVISDYRMPPGPNGLALLEAVRDRWPEVRRVLTSGEPVVGVEEAIAAGWFEAFLAKPIAPALLAAVVAGHSGSRHL